MLVITGIVFNLKMVYSASSLAELQNEVQKNITTSLSYVKELKEYILDHNMTENIGGLGSDLVVVEGRVVEGLTDHVAPRLLTNADLNSFDLAALETIVKRHMSDCMTARNNTEDFGYSGDC